MKRNFLGIFFICLSILISLANIFSVKITGAVIGLEIKSSFLILLTFLFFFIGIFSLGNLEKRILNYAKVLALAGTTVYMGHRIHHTAKEDAEKSKPDIESVRVVSSWKTPQGKFERTYRWDETLDKVEEKYQIPKGLLKGLAMRESYGDPLRLNESGDGGAGLFMFQPGTAREMGLKVYGTSKRVGSDKKHGEELKELMIKNNSNYEKMAEFDERFHIEKSSDAAGAYLKKLHNRYGSWDKALSAYNQGRPAPNSEETKHVKAVREYQSYYNERDKRGDTYTSPKVNAKRFANKRAKR